MSLPAGTRLGAYQIVSLLGAGGMGEVYRARDAKLQRDVAIKILPSLFARDSERLARFEREARTLAALNHPHIAQAYGLVDLPAEAGSHGLVLEFVDGEDLSERIRLHGRIPLDEALAIAAQVVEALEAAHEQGIIHRDLKPANIKLRVDGQAKVLDFGLAKALAPVDPAGRDVNIENSPTITSPFQLSQLGVVLGTAAYMSPEQAKGKPVDKRADIWAFGCVFYEMLAGRRPFAGEDVTDTLAAIVRADPDWSCLPPETPAGVRTLLRRCLEKDRRERLPDIGAARLELRDALHPVGGGAAPPVPAPRGRGGPLPWLLFAAAVIAALAAIGHDVLMRPATDVRTYKSVILPPAALSGAPALRLQVSPDGRRLAFVAPDEAGRPLLWVRPLDGFAAQALNGTVNAVAPFWSADSRWLAFFADGKLKKIEIATGTITTLCDAIPGPPGSWNRDDVIIFTSTNGLSRVPAAGGKPEALTRLAAGELTHICPFFLPDGHHFLYTAIAAGATRGVFAGSLDSAEVTRLLDDPTNAVYADRRLLFLRDGTLMAQPFDPDTRRLSGAAVPIAEPVLTNFGTGTGAFSVSQNGVLVYQTGNYAGTQLVWYDRAGHALGTLGEPKGYRDVQMSADGRFVSVTVSTAAQSRVWVFDVLRNLGRPFTVDNEVSQAAVWTPDGQSIIYSARRGASFDLFRRSSTGGDSETLLLHDDFTKLPLEVTATANGLTLLYRIPRAAERGELWLLPLTGERTPRALAPGNANQVPAAVSPDGRWLAYAVDEGPHREVYVTSFPDGNGNWPVSSDGGDNPRWRADGKELFFAANDRLLAVDVTTSANQFAAGPVKELFTMRVPASVLGTRATYAPSPDGQKFLVNTYDQRAEVVPITVVVNWANGLPK